MLGPSCLINGGQAVFLLESRIWRTTWPQLCHAIWARGFNVASPSGFRYIMLLSIHVCVFLPSSLIDIHRTPQNSVWRSIVDLSPLSDIFPYVKGKQGVPPRISLCASIYLRVKVRLESCDLCSLRAIKRMGCDPCTGHHHRHVHAPKSGGTNLDKRSGHLLPCAVGSPLMNVVSESISASNALCLHFMQHLKHRNA